MSTKPTKAEALEEIKSVVDKYGKLCAEYEVAKRKFDAAYPEFKEIATLKSQIQELSDILTRGKESDDYEGDNYIVHVTPKSSSTTVLEDAKVRLRAYLGSSFDKLWTVSVTALKKELTSAQLRDVTKTTYTGARTITIKPK